MITDQPGDDTARWVLENNRSPPEARDCQRFVSSLPNGAGELPLWCCYRKLLTALEAEITTG
jgi:hypothetical protein